ncbi:COX15-CtaA-domain-containing protein [Dacryopinax primogenitus]|uniref:COX15-CtaA-domain-containing protein n=1 Tax=Dacryopinax primogenitus (strain DJM 731) TaxID=1858805 RepID=M5FNM8_DACPD|nr:COX15-CtaA-domain-containing protein [Dacryopinax primogenitus]EJT97700.1 COX15-CtaA-domain-containing protein [Dacryopinax primogenitus]
MSPLILRIGCRTLHTSRPTLLRNISNLGAVPKPAVPFTVPAHPAIRASSPSRILSLFRPSPKLRFFATSFPLGVRPLPEAYFTVTRGLATVARTHPSQPPPPSSPSPSPSPSSNSSNPTPSAEQVEEEVSPPLQPLSPASVGYWLFLLAALSFSIITVGGVTRLTESGLSITEWRPVTGTLPPMSDEAWDEEFRKYRSTPEYKMLNTNITLEAFKRIYYMEYSHRLLGRFIGLVLLVPFGYYLARHKLTPGLPSKLLALTVLLGAQGALGWYMVASGLEDEILHTPGAVPRVSQYRLAAHLGAALVFYAGLVLMGLSVLRDAAYVKGKGWRADGGWERAWAAAPAQMRQFRLATYAVAALVFVTALSGAFVAGLDAGLIYNEFPLMGGRLIPPGEELVRPEFSQVRIKHTRKDSNGAQSVHIEELDQPWRNIFENPTTVQFDHRALAVTAYVAVGALHFLALRFRKVLPLHARRLAGWSFGFANLQVALGISTLIYLVPVELAAAHQAGSVCLLTALLALMAVLRRPGKWGILWREAVKRGQVRR